MRRLRRLYEEKENARDRTVTDGSDKEVKSLTGPNYGGYAGRLRRLCAKKPGMGRYPMGPTNIDIVDIGSCQWYPTFVVDKDSECRLRESTSMKLVNQVKRSKVAYQSKLRRLCGKITEVMREDYGGYARRRKKPGIGRYPMGPTKNDLTKDPLGALSKNYLADFVC